MTIPTLRFGRFSFASRRASDDAAAARYAATSRQPVADIGEGCRRRHDVRRISHYRLQIAIDCQDIDYIAPPRFASLASASHRHK